MSVQVLESPQRGGPAPTAADVVLLQSVRGLPAVSVLMPTPRGRRLDLDGAARLTRLIDVAGTRLLAETGPEVAEHVVGELRSMAAEAVETVSEAGLALFASELLCRWFALPVPVTERVAVDPSFATRDLVRSLQRTPLHTVLLLTPAQAELFECTGRVVAPVGHGRFAMRRAAFPSESSFLRAVDAALSAHLRARPSPVVVAGERGVAELFVARTRATTRLAGVVEHDPTVDDLDVLVQRVGPVLSRYLRSRESEAVDRLARTPGRRVARGLDAVWLAARREPPEMLVVEEDFFQPARLSDDGDRLLPAADPTAPDVLDDVVDEVIEAVLRRGGWVAITAPGMLAEHGRIALTVRQR
jgi:hypothetical protein